VQENLGPTGRSPGSRPSPIRSSAACRTCQSRSVRACCRAVSTSGPSNAARA